MALPLACLAPALLMFALTSDPCGCYQHYDICLQGCAGGQACAQGCQDRYDYCTKNCSVHLGLEFPQTRAPSHC